MLQVGLVLLKRLEAHLADRDWLVGAGPTIADVALYSYLSSAPEGNVDLSAYPRVDAFLRRIEALPGFVTGQLLGLDIGRTLEVTNCFAFPTKDDDAGGGGKGDGDDDEDGAEYQIEMMRSLREVNVDNNTVGWYQSTYFSSFIDDSCIETQFNYQENIKNCCVIIYDPSRARAGS